MISVKVSSIVCAYLSCRIGHFLGEEGGVEGRNNPSIIQFGQWNFEACLIWQRFRTVSQFQWSISWPALRQLVLIFLWIYPENLSLPRSLLPMFSSIKQWCFFIITSSLGQQRSLFAIRRISKQLWSISCRGILKKNTKQSKKQEK